MLLAKLAPWFVVCDFIHSLHVLSLFQGMKSNGFHNSVTYKCSKSMQRYTIVELKVIYKLDSSSSCE